MPLRAIESHPMVARCELTENNSKIKIHASSKGESNIIIYDPNTKIIYDVFKVAVFSSLQLPKRININLGAEISFLSKDEKRKFHLIKDSTWTVDNASVFKIDPISGKATALKEGKALVQLISNDHKKVKLSTNIFVSKLKRVSVDSSKFKYITDVKENINYREEYR